MMKKIYFVRHGITDVHVEARKVSVMGFPDVGLNEQGIKDCYQLINKLKDIKIDGIISSDLESAAQTAKILNTYFKVPLYFSQLLRERSQGEFTGKALLDIYNNDSSFSITTDGEGRENLRSFMNRTKQAFTYIAEDFNWDACLVVSHKGFLQTMMATCMNVKPVNWYLCEVREIIWEEDSRKWKVN